MTESDLPLAAAPSEGAFEDNEKVRSHARGWCTRLAPSPTGALHLGHARTFWATWLEARRAAGGRLILRLEDLDGPRQAVGAPEAIQTDLSWLGIDWDGPIEIQSRQPYRYLEALDRLARGGHLYACTLSRADLEAIASAPHGAPAGGRSRRPCGRRG